MSHRAGRVQASINSSEPNQVWEHQTNNAARRRADTRHELHKSHTSIEVDSNEDFIVEASHFYTAKDRERKAS